MNKIFHKSEDGIYSYIVDTSKLNTVYVESFIKYINCLSPLFDKAKRKSEFEYILALLQFRGISEPGHNPFENTIAMYEEVFSIQNKIKDSDKKLNLAFWAYAHWIEASEPYEMIGNLLGIIGGGRYIASRFPKKSSGKFMREQYPYEKILHLKTLAENIQMGDSLVPIEEIYDRELRNSIFHSDYTIYNQEMRSYKIFSQDETYNLINKTVAYFKAFKFLYDSAISEYETPKLILIPTYFNNFKYATTISRKGYGLVGMKDNHCIEDIERGAMTWHVVKVHGYELKMLNSDKSINQFPSDKVEKLNKILKYTPRIIRKFFRQQINLYKKKLVDAW